MDQENPGSTHAGSLKLDTTSDTAADAAGKEKMAEVKP